MINCINFHSHLALLTVLPCIPMPNLLGPNAWQGLKEIVHGLVEISLNGIFIGLKCSFIKYSVHIPTPLFPPPPSHRLFGLRGDIVFCIDRKFFRELCVKVSPSH
jgi:hypothetical protein